MDRVKTGIDGMDELLQGGIPQGSSVLVTGGAGTGKTIYTMQYIYNGAQMFKEPGIFVAIETNLKNIMWNMQSFNWDIRKMQEDNLMRTYRMDLGHTKRVETVEEKIDEELGIISEMVNEINAKRLVIDSITAFGIWFERQAVIRSLLYQFTNKLKNLDCTTLLTTETKGGRDDFSAFGVEEFVVDGVIAMYFTPPHRSVFVKKMRGTDHSKTVHPFDITSNGIRVKSKDQVLWDSIR